MEVTIISLAIKLGSVAIVGGASLLAITGIRYYHYASEGVTQTPNSNKRGGVNKNENKSTSEKIRELRKAHQV